MTMYNDVRPCRRRPARRGPSAVVALLLPVFCSMSLTPPARADDATDMSLEQLLDVRVVTASKYEQRQSDVAAAVNIITRAEIKAHGWRTLAEALASLPGTYTTYDRQYLTLGARGFAVAGDFGSRTLVTINGNRVNDPVYDSGTVGPEFPLDLDLVERIEYIPGPGGAVYGQNAMFGVINVVTLHGRDLAGAELKASLQGPQLLREGRASWGKSYDGGPDVLLSVTDLRVRGQDPYYDFGAAGVAGVAQGMDGEQAKQFLVQLAQGPWSFEIEHGKHRKDDPVAAQLSDPLVPGSYQGDRFDLGQLRYSGDIDGDALNLAARLFTGQYRYASQYYYNGAATRVPALGAWAGAELRLVANHVAGHRPMVGFEFQDNYHQDQYAWVSGNPAANVALPASGHRSGVYVQDEWRINDAFTSTLGVRGDHNSDGFSASPRAGLIWRADPDETVKWLYGRAYRAPNIADCCYGDGLSQAANPRLKGETIDTFELVGDRRIASDLAVRASVYRWNMHRLITLGTDPLSGLAQFQSGPAVRAQGIELSADQTWSYGGRLRDSLSYQYAGYEQGGELPNSPRLLGKLNYSAPLPDAVASWFSRVGYGGIYNGRRRTLAGATLGAYCLSSLDLTAERWAPGLEVSIVVNNLFGQPYAQPGASNNWQDSFAQDGRSVRLDASYRF